MRHVFFFYMTYTFVEHGLVDVVHGNEHDMETSDIPETMTWRHLTYLIPFNLFLFH